MKTKTFYKGFDKNMQCLGFQYEVGQTYETDELIMCSKGFHFCEKLTDCYSYYKKEESIFCIVEPLGKIIHNSTKSVTDKIKIVRVLTKSEMLGQEFLSSKIYEIIRKLHYSNINFIVGGSTALCLYSVDMKRHLSDLDIIMPYYQKISDNPESNLTSGCDYDFSTEIKNTKIDVRIDNKQRYEIRNIGGLNIKLSPLVDIIEAKARYAKNNKKHEIDLLNMLNIDVKLEKPFNL